jgi:hypothetical protein
MQFTNISSKDNVTGKTSLSKEDIDKVRSMKFETHPSFFSDTTSLFTEPAASNRAFEENMCGR